MKFSYSFLKKFLSSPPAKKRLIEGLSFHSFETEEAGGDVLEITLPANRYSDAASHLGIAREAAVIFGLSARGGSAWGGKNPVREIINPPTDQGFLKVEIKNNDLCPRYAARFFEIKKVSSSPIWMQKILKSCGLKPINNIVDLMNYVMLEVGQPLHAFDFDKIKGANPKSKSLISKQAQNSKLQIPKTIIIRRARNGEKIETLDEQKFTLDKETLVIADAEKALAIAGVKGGLNSGVDKKTKRIIVEAANFESTGIYKTSRRLKLQTDASLRFSHSLSPALVDFGLDRATELLVKSGAKLIDSVDVYPKPVGEELIEFDTEKYEKLIGASVAPDRAKNYFRALGFIIESSKTKSPSSFWVRIPAWRTDIENFEDLAEEIGRLSDYNKLKPAAPSVSIKPAEEEDIIILKDRIRDFLRSVGIDEVYNYSFVSDQRPATSDQKFLSPSAGLVELENPLSDEFKYLRADIVTNLIKNIESNSRFFDKVRIFEIGKIFFRHKDKVEEKLHLGIALSGEEKKPLTLELKGIADELLRGLGLTDFYFVEAGGVLRIENKHQILGYLDVARLAKKKNISVAEFDLEKILPLVEEERQFKPLSKYPAVIRDISILVSKDVRIGDILQEIQESSPELIENVDLFDEYEDEKFAGRKSITFRIVFQAEDRTLTDKEVNEEMKKIESILKKTFKAEIR